MAPPLSPHPPGDSPREGGRRGTGGAPLGRHPALRPALALAAALALSLAACAGDAAPGAGPGEGPRAGPAAAPASPTPAEAAASPAPPAPAPAAGRADAGRAFAHVEMLAATIGPRTAGSAEERRAAEYVAGELQRSGYEVSVETFPVPPAPGAARASSPLLDGALPATYMGGAPEVPAAGPVVLVPGRGRADDFASVEAEGAVAVVARGVITFAEKARNAERAGAAALVVVNSEPGELLGTLGELRPGIPVLGVSPETGASIEALADASPGAPLALGPPDERLQSQNVVARPPGGSCGAYLGAHYDSVPDSPGANDNASGVALILELARVLTGAPGSESLCVVAFGAEEVGLVGSRAFVRAHDVRYAAFMLNFDMVSKMTAPTFIHGDAELAAYASRVAAELGEDLPPGGFPPYASSDHASFEASGVAAITVHSGDDPFIHRPEDDIRNASPGDLARMLLVSEELARRLLARGGVPRE